jgi:hypothetical protein
MPFPEVVLVLLCIVDRFGDSDGGAGVESSSPFTVEVEVERPKPLVRGARCVSFNSTNTVSQSTNSIEDHDSYSL